MTIEEKAKRYDEALERAKRLTSDMTTLQKIREFIFPELAESEDERIRKSLIKFLTAIKIISESGRTTWAVRKEDAERCKSFLAYLERQKEPENTSASTMAPSCLEVKQKEQKEETLRDFIDNFPYSAEQKEQDWNKKPCLTCQEYEKGHKQGYTEGCTAGYNKAMKEFEQKEQNGEDGFLEDELSAFLQNYDKEYDDDAAVSDVARHFYEIGKKQKEQKPVPFSCGHENGQSGEKQNYSELNDLERAILRGFLAAGVENVPIGIIKDTASECVRFLALTESKSEWSEEDKKMLNHLIDKIQENLNIRMPDGHSFGISNDEKETFSSWLRCLPERFNLQPNQEWSEEDEAAYNAFICEVVNEKMNPTAEQVKWLRSICDRLKFLYPQPKAEWSEEDESSLKELIHYFESLLDCLATEKGHAENRKWLKFLKSLRPQSKQEWGKEDKEMRDTCIDLLEHFPRPCGEVIGPWKDCIAWLKSLRPSWKPSKEQMSMLLAVINDPNNAGAESCYMALKSIYNNLKKL